MEKDLSGSIALTKLKHVIMDAKGKGGTTVRGIFIPIEANLLLEKEKAIYMAVKVKYKSDPDQFGQNGFIAKTTESSIWKELDETEKAEAKALSPILGNIKEWTGNANDTSGAAAPGVVNEDDDLPF